MATAWESIDPRWAWQAYVPARETPWDLRRAAHLFRRAAFGASRPQLAAALQGTPAEAVQQLLRGVEETVEQQRAGDELARTILATGDAKQLSAWWTYVLLHTRHPLRERMTLFWHGHFATSGEKVHDAGLMLEQNRMLRRHALGDFRAFVQDVSRDPAMLLYLDSATNRKAHPNENYARELMELFTLGEGHYSEQDVQQLARCFTGWEVMQNNFRFNRFQHDRGDKTILGRTGAFPDGSAIDWVLEQPQAARFIVGKLFRQFVCDEPPPPESLLEPLAEDLREQAWQIAPVVQRMLSSQLFFSEFAVGRKVRSPVDAAVGLLRSLDGSANAVQLADDLLQNGQGLFFPPNVKGWDGGRTWINSSTLLGRINMVGRVLRDDKTRWQGGKLADYLMGLGADTPERSVDFLVELLVAVPVAPATRARLVELCGRPGDQSSSLLETLHAIAALPEFQLG